MGLSRKSRFRYFPDICQSHKIGIAVLLLLLLSVAEFRLLDFLHAPHFTSLVDAAEGVVLGTPHWRAYAARLLGPYMVQGISEFGFTYAKSLTIFNLVLMVLCNLAAFVLAMIVTDKNVKDSVSFVLAYGLFYILIQHDWSYTWDYLDLLIFTAFLIFVHRKSSLLWLGLIFLASLANRESALFIPLWIIFESITLDLKNRRRLVSISNVYMLMIGVIAMVFSIMFIKYVRDMNFIRTLRGGLDLQHLAFGNHVSLLSNIKQLAHNVFDPKQAIISAAYVAYCAFIMANVHRLTERTLKLVLLSFVMLLTNLIFGIVNETRTYAILIPFVLYFVFQFPKDAMNRAGIPGGSSP